MPCRIALPPQTSASKSLDDWLFDEEGRLDFGWVQFEGFLNGDPHPERGPWLGVSWDTPDRGTRTDAVWQGITLFEPATTSVSFIRRNAIPPWSLEGISFVEAVAKRYGFKATEADGIKFKLAARGDRAVNTDQGLVVPAQGALWADSAERVTMVGVKAGQKWMEPEQILELQTISLSQGMLSRILPVSQMRSELHKLILQNRQFEKLQDLDLSHNGLLRDWMMLRDLENLCPNLVSLNLTACHGLLHSFTLNVSRKVSLSVSQLQLCDMWISHQDKSISRLKEVLQKFPKLTSLALARNWLDHDNLYDFKNTLALNLTSLDLSGNWLTDLSRVLQCLRASVTSLDISDNRLTWGVDTEPDSIHSSDILSSFPSSDVPDARTGLEFLNADRTNLSTWLDFFILCRSAPNLESLRVWQNPLFANEQEDQEILKKNRYIRWSALPSLTHCDGEFITASMRKEAELYMISLARRWKQNLDLFSTEESSIQRGLATAMVQDVCARQDIDFESLGFCVDRNESVAAALETLKMHIMKNLPNTVTEQFNLITPLDDQAQAVLQMPPTVHLDITIGKERTPVNVSVYPTYTTVESLKAAIGQRLKEPDMTSWVMIWELSRQAPMTQCCPKCEASSSSLHKSKEEASEIVLEPDYHRLSYFGIEDSMTYTLHLRRSDRSEFSHFANYERSIDAAIGHGVLRRLR